MWLTALVHPGGYYVEPARAYWPKRHLRERCSPTYAVAPLLECRSQLLQSSLRLEHSWAVTEEEYYTSERFIHDELVRRAEDTLYSLYDTWRQQKSIQPFLLCWPAGPVTANNGASISGPCVLELPPEGRDQWHNLILGSVRATGAYALLLVEQKESHIQVTLESQHGAHCWKMQIVQRGVDRILKQPTPTVNEEHVGVLWSPQLPNRPA